MRSMLVILGCTLLFGCITQRDPTAQIYRNGLPWSGSFQVYIHRQGKHTDYRRVLFRRGVPVERFTNLTRRQTIAILKATEIPEIDFRNANEHDVMHYFLDVAVEFGPKTASSLCAIVHADMACLVPFSARHVSLHEALKITGDVTACIVKVDKSGHILMFPNPQKTSPCRALGPPGSIGPAWEHYKDSREEQKESPNH